MNNVNKTLYIPLYGKSYVSQRGILLRDPDAEAIWEAEGFPLKGKAKSKWLAYYMAMRAVVFDRWAAEKTAAHPDGVVLHLGCGLDSRACRVAAPNQWFDADFPEVIAQRKRHFQEGPNYRMIGCDLREKAWLKAIPSGGKAIVLMEGISMYLAPEALRALFEELAGHFSEVFLLMDCYSSLAARLSRWKNPINDVGVFRVFGMDDPKAPELLSFRQEWDMTPEELICQLPKGEQRLFRKLYAGKFAHKLYRLYEYEGGNRS